MCNYYMGSNIYYRCVVYKMCTFGEFPVQLFISGVTVGFENATYMIGESEMTITVCIVLIGELERTVTVNLQTNEGSATGKYCRAFMF